MHAALLLHQWKHEIRGLAPLMWIWVPLLAIHGLCGVHGLDWADTMGPYSPMRRLVLTTSGWFVLLPAMIFSLWPTRGDLPLDADAFWRTRPIPGWAVATAKILALATVFALPAFLVDGWLALRIGGVHAIDGLLLESTFVRLGAITGVLALTALAGGAFRMAFVAAGGGIAIGFCVGGLQALLPPGRFDFGGTLIASRFLTAGGCILAGSILLLVSLYHLRRPVVAWSAGIATTLAVILVFLFWPIDWYRISGDQSAFPGVPAPRLTVKPLRIETSPYDRRHPHTLVLQLALTTPRSWPSARLHKVWVDIADPSGRSEAAGWAYLHPKEAEQGATRNGPLPNTIAAADQDVFLRRLHQLTPDRSPPEPILYYARLQVPHDRLIGGECRVKAEVALYDFDQVGTLPLEAGSRLRFDGNTIDVVSLGWNPGNGGQMVISIREDVLQAPFDINGPAAALPSDRFLTSLFGYAILDRAGNLLYAEPSPQQGHILPPGHNETSLFRPVQRNRPQLTVWPRPGEPRDMHLLETYQGQRLVALQRVYAGRVNLVASSVGEGE
jgi:hypothetical protein